VGTDVRIWWESGNRTGFPRSQHRVRLAARGLGASVVRSKPCFSHDHVFANYLSGFGSYGSRHLDATKTRRSSGARWESLATPA